MNNKLKIALKRRSSEQGFALPVAVGMGLILTLVAATMIVRSQGDQVTASAQKVTADSLDVSEVGVSRVQSLLKNFPKMAKKTEEEWKAEYDRLSTANNCLVNTGDLAITTSTTIAKNQPGSWVNVSATDLTAGEFQITNYTEAGNVGTLQVAGRARSESGGTATGIDNAIASVTVNIPIDPLDNVPVPGLWAKTFAAGTYKVRDGIILTTGCSVPILTTVNNVAGTGSLALNPSVEFPPLPNLPSVCPSGLATTQCYQVFKQIPTNTTTDAITNTYVKTSGTVITPRECVIDTGSKVVKEDVNGNWVRVMVSGSSIATCSTEDHKNEAQNLIFPRGTDKPGSDGVYRYLLGVDGGNSIDLKGGSKITITPNQRVVFYLQGNLTMAGRSKIEHTGPPTNFQIYGSDGLNNSNGSLNYGAGTYTTTSIGLSDHSTSNMFIYAPEATAGVSVSDGTLPATTSATLVTGSVWVQSWGGAGANRVVITKPTTSIQWADPNLPMERLRSISAIQSWQRGQAN